MATLPVQAVKQGEAQSPLLAHKLETIADRIRHRAYEIFQHRGRHGSALEDWIQAERDCIFSPESELIENDDSYEIRMAAPGFQAGETTIAAGADAVVVYAESNHKHEEKDGNVRFCEFGAKSLYRRFDLPQSIDVNKVSAHLVGGILRITAHKAKAPVDSSKPSPGDAGSQAAVELCRRVYQFVPAALDGGSLPS